MSVKPIKQIKTFFFRKINPVFTQTPTAAMPKAMFSAKIGVSFDIIA